MASAQNILGVMYDKGGGVLFPALELAVFTQAGGGS